MPTTMTAIQRFAATLLGSLLAALVIAAPARAADPKPAQNPATIGLIHLDSQGF